mmetsp:Transcript_8269/g.15340  ORF Transcript_8269/g.15340 Transcript_8269/m.15340 type:complete len:333 (+) Transcript_8269:110-1108(+)
MEWNPYIRNRIGDEKVLRLIESYLADAKDININSIVKTASKKHEAKVLILGGYLGTKETSEANKTHLYDLKDYAWSEVASMPTHRVHLSAVSVRGKVYAIGGFNDVETLDSVDLYNPSTDTWQKGSSRMSCCRHSFAAVNFEDNIYIFGGSGSKFDALDSCERFDPETNQWTSIAPMKNKRMGSRAVVFEGKIYVLGGQFANSTKDVTNSVCIYDPKRDEWIEGPEMRHARSDFGVMADEKQIVVAAGDCGNQYLMSTERFSSESKEWKELGETNTPRTSFGFFAVNSNLYFVGGYAAERLQYCEYLRDGNVYWRDIPDLPSQRSGHACVTF